MSHVGVEDDFFDIGGNSLKVVQVLSDVHKTFGVDLLLPEFFACTTIRKLAERVAAAVAQ